MILVVLGTHELPFTRLLEAVETSLRKGDIKDEVIVQCGHTSFQSDYMTQYDFLSYDKMDEFYDQADIIITHGGTGSIVSGLKKGKKMIAAARLKKYGEHNDDHQKEIISEFVKANYLLEWREEAPLASVIEEAYRFTPEPFVAGRDKILEIIRRFIS
ncbi:UDP-N-acetylglucosamine transferase subunit ALG13 [Pullulanibacillus pueri]|uniref:Glycosyl transferase family 28 C-terminal domain-containing protein n=1 Tax=Pullulanibacillus pueri TaxID=1437324 RepID=A0A8J2ZTH4_9BACL|nr:PssE/Cps14G family polysaccharide biosynthesis glycosyltransferase [Pullulanibacillus pueri]MBM7681893.1 UDP-N-acetylglucosamine transferase subunit ALG13 [Pullulanibacillus pueri]GGH76496.1 hypothetical protein GCM10007096_07010 [Pullulanibacillus pueri]